MADRTLYDDDIVAWAEEQAQALRRLAASPMAANIVDWANVIEEIESVGRSEWKSVESNLRNALAHMVKGYCDPDSLSRLAWSVESSAFLVNARADYRNSMRAKFDLERVWRDAFRLAMSSLNAYGIAIPPGLPDRCPFTLDDLLDESLDYAAAVKRLNGFIDRRH